MQYLLDEKEYNKLVNNDYITKSINEEVEKVTKITQRKLEDILQTVEYRFIDYFNKEGIRDKNKDIVVIVDSIRQQYLGYDYRKYL